MDAQNATDENVKLILEKIANNGDTIVKSLMIISIQMK